MATLSATALYTAVAAKMDKVVGDYSAADQAEMKVWALDGLRWLLPLAPEHAVTSMLTSVTGRNEPWAISPTSLKVVRVQHTTDGDLARYVSPDVFTQTKYAFTSGTNSFETGQRIWSDVMGTVEVFRIGTSDTIEVDYIKAPSWGNDVFRKTATPDQSWQLILGHTSTGTGDESEPVDGAHYTAFWAEVNFDASHTLWESGGTTYTDNNITIPNGWEGIVCSYAAIQAKVQDEEAEEAESMMKLLVQELTRFHGFENIPISVGG